MAHAGINNVEMKLRFVPMDFKLSSKKTDLVDCAAELMNLI